MKKTIYLFLLLFSALSIKGQTEEELNQIKGYDYEQFIKKTLKKPVAFQFVDYSTKGSVDVATGKFGVNIPFYEISNKYLKIPIGLSYSTSGVKVEEMSSEVGMDWTLFGVGSIIRIQKGLPDLNVQNDEYYYTGRSSYYEDNFERLQTQSVNFSMVQNRMYGFASKTKGCEFIRDFPFIKLGATDKRTDTYGEALAGLKEFGYHDTEPDIFMVNCGDLRFSFILMNDSGIGSHYAISLDKPGVKIDLSDGVTITDTDGVIYEFKNFDAARPEYIRELYNFDKNLSYGKSRAFQFTTRNIEDWFSTAKITKISMPNGEVINYKYILNSYKFPQRTPRKHTGEYKGYKYNVMPSIHNQSIDWLHTQVDSYQIDEIEYVNKYRVKFFYNGVRNDMDNCGLNLSKIELFDWKNNSIRKFDLHKTYSDGWDYYENYKDYRMFLREIVDSKKEYSVSFEYNEHGMLPSYGRLERADIYGYSRGVSTSYPNFPKVYFTPGYVEGNRIDYYEPDHSNYYLIQGEDRSVDTERVGNGAMDVIHFPTGGKLVVEYEPNEYYDGSLKGGNVLGPGVRVHSLNYYSDDSTKELVKRYEYFNEAEPEKSSGHIMFEPYLAMMTNWGWDNETDRVSLQNKTIDSNYFSYWLPFYKSAFWSITDIPFIVTSRELERQGKTKKQIAKKLISLSTHSMGPTSDIWGREIIYSNVTEKLMSNEADNKFNGSKEYNIHYGDNRVIVNVASGPSDDFTYIGQADNASIGSWACWYRTKVSYGNVDKRGTDIYPFPDRDYFNTKHGLLNGKVTGIIERNEKGEIVRFTSWNYTKKDNQSYSSVIKGYLPTHIYDKNDSSQKLIIKNDPVKEYETFGGLYYFARNRYVQESPLLLASKRIINYNNGRQNETNISYGYDMYGQLNEVVRENSRNEFIKSMVKYPEDYRGDLIGFDPNDDINDPDAASTAIYKMLQNNMLNLPIEYLTINQSTGDVVDGEIVSYSYRNNQVFPYSKNKLCLKEPVSYNSAFDSKIITSDPNYSYSLDYNSNYQNQIIYSSYDEELNLEQYSKSNDVEISYLWGYNNSYPVAQVRNASINEIENCFTNSELNNIKLGNYADNEMRTMLNKIRYTLTDAEVTTYTYIPLIGKTSETDPKGITTFYEYDGLGRLVYVRNDDGDILKKYKYNYGN